MKGLHKITFILLVVGGLNWLLVGVWGWDIRQWFGGMDASVSRLIYVLVGASAVIELFIHGKSCKQCGKGGGMM